MATNTTLATLDVSCNHLDPASVRMLLTRTKLALLDASFSACDLGAKAELMTLAVRIGMTLRI
ncbi:hypothetical protein ACKZDW_03925 (plasmid) [Ralstonia syzygii subsp. celebesensis]